MSNNKRGLFEGDDDWWHNAWVGKLGDKWSAYATGYKQAADTLVERLTEDRMHLDTMVYPTIFLYRHYIELRLKEIVRDGNLLMTGVDDFPKHHRIKDLWSECRRLVEEVWRDDDREPLVRVEDYINRLAQYDSDSFAFRYSTDKKGNENLQGTTLINIRRFAEIMAEVSTLLDGISMALSHYLDVKGEMQSDV